MPSLIHSRFTVALALPRNDLPQVCLYHTLSGALALVPARVWESVAAGRPDPGDAIHLNTLHGQGLVVSPDLDEDDLFRHWMQQYVHDYTNMRSKVLVTRRCNLRCAYCIIEPEAGQMSSATARAMDAWYLGRIARRRPRRVRDDYLGGEPLLNPSIILESAERRHLFCRGMGVDYGFSITTNGTLLDAALVKRLQAVGLTRIRVSMAGPQAVHDRLRCLPGGVPTYARIADNLAALENRVPILIECQYDAATDDYRQVPGLLDDFAQRGIALENIAFTPILARRHDNHFSCGVGDPSKFLYLQSEALKRGYPQLDEPPQSGCMADLRSVLVFDTDGSIIPCPSVQGGEMAYGHVSRGVDFTAESQLIHRRLPDRCQRCELLPMCLGAAGCRP
jgi:radical SAM protein with 4Fe4S-binding SPASM domain